MKSLPICRAIPGSDFKVFTRFSPNDLANSEMLISPLVNLENAYEIALIASTNF